MKNISQLTLVLKYRVFIALVLGMFSTGYLNSQDSADESSKATARINLDYTNYNNNGPRLTATVKTKVDRSYENVEGVKINYYLNEVSSENNLGTAITGHNGQAILILPDSMIKIMQKHNKYIFIAAIENDDRFKDRETEIEIKNAYIDLTLKVEDSIKIIDLFVGGIDSLGEIIPTEDVEARIFVKRLFGNLPISEDYETTNDEGILTIEFPNDIPGDQYGNLKIIAKVEEHEEYGNLVMTKEIGWGVPIEIDEDKYERELWSSRSNAPYSLVIIVNGLLIGIWGVIGYVILQIYKLYKIGKSNKQQLTE